MTRRYSPNHPAVRSHRERTRAERLERFQEWCGLTVLLATFGNVAWLSTHDAPGLVTLSVLATHVIAALALLMPDK